MMTFQEKEFPKFHMDDSVALEFCLSQPLYLKLNAEEKKFYCWVNFSRRNPMQFYQYVVLPIVKLYPQLQGSYLTSLKNDLSKAGSLTSLNLNLSLMEMAKHHSIDITSHQAAPSHNATNGDSFSDRFSKTIKSKCGGENISYGGNNPVFLLVLLYLDIDTPELGHRKALLTRNSLKQG